MKQAVRVVLLSEIGLCVAQCLEYDLAAQGPNIEAALHRLAMAFIDACLEHGKAMEEVLDPAPGRYFNLWDAQCNSWTRFDHHHNAWRYNVVPEFRCVICMDGAGGKGTGSD